MYNGFTLYVPKNTTKFLERMADALDPNAPTEQDAIKWVYTNTRKSIFFTLTSTFLIFYCKIWGTSLLEAMTKSLLEQNVLPEGVDREKLTDRTLRQSDEPIIKCDAK